MTDTPVFEQPTAASEPRTDIRLIAFYLPQFHPIKENDAWWGRGFTEWTNVTRAEPLFNGHHQPHLPTELGFYDLRLREARRAQIAMARQYGIDAFCYHYYWFSGKRLLEAPLEDMLADKGSAMPFCLCWANESWSRRWNGGDQDILIEQKYLEDDPHNFIRDLAPYLQDSRYLRIAGKPLLVIYRPQAIPQIRKVVAAWRRSSHELGIGDIHLCAALTFDNVDYEQFGFDSGVEFPPHNRTLLGLRYSTERMSFHGAFDGSTMLYHDLAEAYLNRDHNGKTIFRGLFPSWDNTARTRNRALVFLNGTPGNYEFWLDQTIRKTRASHTEAHRLIFINAWNEWAESCHLEPDQRYGRRFLEATLRAKSGLSSLIDFPDREIPVDTRLGFGALAADVRRILRKHVRHLVGEFYIFARVTLSRNPPLKKLSKWLLGLIGRD